VLLPKWQTSLRVIQRPILQCSPEAPHSVCCAVGDSCTDAGLCYHRTGLSHRGRRTDATWNDPACPRTCSQGLDDKGTTRGMRRRDPGWLEPAVLSASTIQKPIVPGRTDPLIYHWRCSTVLDVPICVQGIYGSDCPNQHQR
jgi:hypothetical protein